MEINKFSINKDWNKFDKKNNKTIGLNILYVPYNTEEIRHAYKSNHNLNRKNQIILLMITDGEKWHYLAVKHLSALLRRIKSNHNGDFYRLNCLHPYRTKDRLKNIKMYVRNKIIVTCYVPKEDNKY